MIDKNRLQAKCSTWNIPLTGVKLVLVGNPDESVQTFRGS